jgi:hypothetical protein
MKKKKTKKEEAIEFFEFFLSSKNPLYNAVKSSVRHTIKLLKSPYPFWKKRK